MTKKKPPRRRLRPRTPYESALNRAQARLEKASNERTNCLVKLEELSHEIPYLEGIVQALTPPAEAKNMPATAAAPVMPSYIPPPVPPVTGTMDQEDFLAKDFMAKYAPRAGRITTSTPQPGRGSAQPDGGNPDPDEFLSDNGPGQEILS